VLSLHRGPDNNLIHITIGWLLNRIWRHCDLVGSLLELGFHCGLVIVSAKFVRVMPSERGRWATRLTIVSYPRNLDIFLTEKREKRDSSQTLFLPVLIKFMSNTPLELTTSNQVVIRVWGTVLAIADAFFLLLVIIGSIQRMKE
jgi:hypothetical protein